MRESGFFVKFVLIRCSDVVLFCEKGRGVRILQIVDKNDIISNVIKFIPFVEEKGEKKLWVRKRQ